MLTIDKAIDLPGFFDTSRPEIGLTRQRGDAIADQTSEVQVHGVAAPLRGSAAPANGAVATVSVATPISQLNANKHEVIGRALRVRQALFCLMRWPFAAPGFGRPCRSWKRSN